MDSFLLFISFILILRVGFTASPQPELHLLLTFKSSLPNPTLLTEWNPTLPMCSFPGVTCRDSVITSVSLFSLPLSVNFNAVISSLLLLPHLESLTIKGGNLTGNLNNVTSCGVMLTALDVSSNSLTASLSDVARLSTLCASLQRLDLSTNFIGGSSGPVATVSFNLNLTALNLSYNKLTAADFASILSSPNEIRNLSIAGNGISGNIPAITNGTCLISLDLSDNGFYGDIKDGVFSNCFNVEFLNMSNSRFVGEVPVVSTSLVNLYLGNNNFSGNFPIEKLILSPKIRVIDLAFNNLGGEMADKISDLLFLEVLDLSSNRLLGRIPGKLSWSLVELYLQNNKFSGEIPASISECENLVSLDLSFNYLSGKIPSSFGGLTKLKDLIMWQNLLEGEIPRELMHVKTLENLILDNNGLTGTIPDLQSCTSLNWISLSSNHLTGEIPSWIGKLSNLAILKLGNNSLYGNIPGEIGNCKSLIWLDLNSNRLDGSIPSMLAMQSGFISAGLVTGKRYVYLKNDGSSDCRGSGNLLEFSGIKPEDLNRLPSRRTCNCTRVYMGSTQYTFNNNGSMIFLDLSCNQLEGAIPKELGKMYYLMILNLGHNLLSGAIPFDLGNMRYVAVLDLSHNALEGEIPGSFSRLSMLSEIDLSNNQLSGSIPESGSLVTFPRVRYENNSDLCGFPLPTCEELNSKSPDQHSKDNKSLARSILLGLLIALFIVLGLIIIVVESRKREKRKMMKDNDSLRDIYIDSNSHSGYTSNTNWKLTTSTKEALSITLATFEKPLQKLTLQHLLDATNGFHNDALIGSGGFGDVYKAQLKDGSIVAIKKLIHISGQGDREFTAEMETIGKVKHRNLVPLLGYCRVGDERLLVYEHMKYGSLEDVLHDRKKSGIKLNWAARRKIAIGAARGLAFLHHSCIPHIIHRDMKSSNVLLDEKLEARVSDFGMAREMNAMDTHLSVSTLAGTPGYVPPEYYQSFRCTTKGDVYSYGVVLLELLTGKNPTDSIDFGDNNLVGWVKQHSKLRTSDVFDAELMKEDPTLELELLEHLEIACACLDDRAVKRPTMVKVMAMFKEVQAGWSVDLVNGEISMDDTSLKEGKEDRD